MTDDAVETTPSAPEEENTSVLAPAANPDLRWYVVHAYSGMEKAVERNITERINRAAMQDKFGRIMVPTEEWSRSRMARSAPPSVASSLAMSWSR